jgi:hypothetical protein
MLNDGTYWWTAYAYDGADRGPLMETASFTVQGSGVDDAPAALALYPARPNPSGSETTLIFTLPERTNVLLAVYSVDGRLVKKLVAGEAGPGTASVVWDCRDEGEVRRGKLLVMR